MEKILVCITPQSNSQRLIDKAAEVAEFSKGELYILNVQKGDSIFLNDTSAELLESLFSYGSKKGGLVHALAGEDIPGLIAEFSTRQEITKVLLGAPVETAGEKGSYIIEYLKKTMRGVEIMILEREH